MKGTTLREVVGLIAANSRQEDSTSLTIHGSEDSCTLTITKAPPMVIDALAGSYDVRIGYGELVIEA